MARAAQAGIFSEIDVTGAMILIFNRPVPAVPGEQLRRCSPRFLNGGDAVDGFGAFPAGSEYLPHPVDPEDLRKMRAIHSARGTLEARLFRIAPRRNA